MGKCRKVINCHLSKNRNRNRCVLLKKIAKKPKSQLSWKEAKLKYPCLSPSGNADGDMHENKKDCRPFNKKKHMVSTTEQDEFGNTLIYATPKEFVGYQKIHYGRAMGLPPIETHKELKLEGLTGDEMRIALALYEKSKKGGIKIIKGMPPWYSERLATKVKTGEDPIQAEHELSW